VVELDMSHTTQSSISLPEEMYCRMFMWCLCVNSSWLYWRVVARVSWWELWRRIHMRSFCGQRLGCSKFCLSAHTTNQPSLKPVIFNDSWIFDHAYSANQHYVVAAFCYVKFKPLCWLYFFVVPWPDICMLWHCVKVFLGSIAAIARCGLSVCLSVGHVHQPCKNC